MGVSPVHTEPSSPAPRKKPSLSTEIHVPQDLLVTKLHDKEPPTSDKEQAGCFGNSGGSTVGQNPGKYLIHY